MTEAEWLVCADPAIMLKFLRVKASERKLRLFAVACARATVSPGPSIGPSIELAERYADGEASEAELARGRKTGPQSHSAGLVSFWLLADMMGRSSRQMAERFGTPLSETAAGIIRDLVGNPFRPVVVDRSWLTSDVIALATSIYQDRAFDQLPILADALEDAGCQDEELLGHLRSAGLHCRSCWAVDLLLGKE